MFRGLSLSLVLVLAIAGSQVFAEDPGPIESRLLPASTVLYLEVPEPTRVLSLVFDHPLRSKIESLDAYRAAINSEPYKKFLLARTVVEAQVQMPWRQALEAFLAHGVVVAVDRQTEGVVLLIRGKDDPSMKLLGEKLLEFAKLSPNPERIKQAEYRGLQVHQVDKTIFAVIGDRLVVTNKGDLGKAIANQFLDGGESLADQPRFQTAVARRESGLTAWGYADVESLRDAGVARDAFFSQINQPIAELLFGGIQSSLQKTPYATASVHGHPEKLQVSLEIPHQHDWIPDSREYYFGPQGQGRAPRLPLLPETVFSLGTYRDFSQMWLRAGDLYDTNLNDKFAKADSDLSNLFSGRDFGEDILGSFHSEVGVLAVRQDFTDILPQPAIKLPSAAAIFRLREPEKMSRELRRIFQSLVGFLNVVGAMNGQHQLELNMEAIEGGGELVSASYVPESDEENSQAAEIVFNFSPSLALMGDRCILASSQSLARTLISMEDAGIERMEVNSQAQLDPKTLRNILADNRAQLISQNRLQEGTSQEEAEANVELLLQLLDYFQEVSVSLGTQDDHLQLQLSLEIRP
jgi:hypothetical protein